MGKVNFNKKNMDELVITPGGKRPKSNVHLIENGFHVNLKDGILREINSATNDVVKELGKGDSVRPEHFINRNILRKSVMRIMSHNLETIAASSSPITDRWIIYSGWQNETGNPISYFSTKWIVPPPPTTDNNQLIYLFNGIETSSYNLTQVAF